LKPGLLLALVVCAVLTFVGLAHAEGPPRATLVVTRGAGADDCPNAQDLGARVLGITGRRSLETSPQAQTDTWVYLEFTHDLGRYGASVQLRGRRQGARALSDVGADCSSLADAVAVTLALFLDAEQRAPAANPAPASVSVHRPPVVAADSPQRYLVLGGGAGFGLLARPSPLAMVGLDLGLGQRFRLGIGGAAALAQRVTDANGYTELGLAYGYARSCALALGRMNAVALELCLALDVGALSGSGHGYDVTERKRLLWSALSGGVQALGPLAAPSFWWLSAMVVTPLTLRGFAVATSGVPHDVFLVPRVGGVASFGMGVRF
jgi:hypothetical protein